MKNKDVMNAAKTAALTNLAQAMQGDDEQAIATALSAFCGTVRDELMEWASTCGYDEATAQEQTTRLGLAGLGARHPYDLSGGQRQLLALVKLLLIGPELLLLDEPTKGLDLASRRIIAHALRDHAQAGGTVIMATHDLDFAEQVADDVAMMFDGEIACMEPPADFFADNVFYRA